MATYVIGDVHGCADELAALLEKIKFNKHKDTAVFVGDLINRGPDSLGVIKQIWALGDAAKVVLGNHDITLIAIALKATSYNSPSFAEILNSDLAAEIVTWYRQQPLLIHLPEYNVVVTHAGIPPRWSVKKASKRARKASAVLMGDDCADYLRSAYKNEVTKWDKSASPADKFTFTINALTRMRYCRFDGELDYSEKASVGRQKKGLYPWFSLRGYSMEPKPLIVFGHWASLGYNYNNYTYCIDSGCVWGGRLTALRVDLDHIEKIQINSLNKALTR